MSGKARRTKLELAALVSAAAALVIFSSGLLVSALSTRSGGELGRITDFSNIYGFALASFSAAFTMMGAVVRHAGSGASPPGGDSPGVSRINENGELDHAAQALAAACCVQWREEAAARDLRRPEPLNIQWSATTRPAAHPAAVLSDSTLRGLPVRLRLRGNVTEIVLRFRQLSRRQLVILGPPGAGKSALAILLTLDWLRQRDPGDPVPVLLSLPSWRPGQEHLARWMARRIAEDYPFLRGTRAPRPGVAERLIASHRIIPVLDGLDELPADHHASAIDQIDREIGDGPVIITCRSDEYQNAVERGGRVLGTAAVIELEPVNIDDAASFLSAPGPSAEARWRPVLEKVRLDPAAPIACALTSPLMVSLARTIYAAPSTSPGELLSLPSRTAVEDHLLSTFIPAVYAGRQAASGLRPGSLHHGYDAAQAQRWLSYLSCHLEQLQTRDLAWWQIAAALPRYRSSLAAGVAVGTAFGIAGIFGGGPGSWLIYGLSYGIAFAAAAAVCFAAGPRRTPTRVEVRIRGTARRFLARMIIGTAIGSALGSAFGLSPSVTILTGLSFGLAIGVSVWLNRPTNPYAVSSPRSLLAQDRIATILFAVPAGLTLVLVGGLGAGSKPDLAFHEFGGIAAILISTLVSVAAGAVVGSLAYGRIGGISFGLAGGVPGALVFGPAYGFVSGAAVGAEWGVMFGLGVALAAMLSRAWGKLLVGRAWLALNGRLPFRLFDFLADAHGRGVLRQAGGVYQFRHARLQEHLWDVKRGEPSAKPDGSRTCAAKATRWPL